MGVNRRKGQCVELAIFFGGVMISDVFDRKHGVVI